MRAPFRCNPASIIYDIQQPKDLKNITISGYKRTDVCKAFQNAILSGKIDEAMRWGVELHCTGMNAKIWETFHAVYLQFIHVHNPHLYKYYFKRRKEYLRAIAYYPDKHEIYSRNDQTIRNLYAEMIAIFTFSKKTHLFQPKSLPRITEKQIYDRAEIRKRMLGGPISQIYPYVDTNDPNEIKLALNEIYTNLMDRGRGSFSTFAFWIIWLEKITAFKKKQASDLTVSVFDLQEKFQCIPTLIEGVDPEYQTHWVWKIWKFLLDYKNTYPVPEDVQAYVEKCFHDYVEAFKPIMYSRKKNLIFIAYYALQGNISWNISLYPRLPLIYQCIGGVNDAYAFIYQELAKRLNGPDRAQLEKMYTKLYVHHCIEEVHRKGAKEKVQTNHLREFVPQIVEERVIRPEDIVIPTKGDMIAERRARAMLRNQGRVNDQTVNRVDFSHGLNPSVHEYGGISAGGKREKPMVREIQIAERRERRTPSSNAFTRGERMVHPHMDPDDLDEVEAPIVSKLLQKNELEKLREEKKNRKMKVFVDFTPIVSSRPHMPSPSPSSPEEIPQIKRVELTRQYAHDRDTE
jgi:hypothetical protein